MPASRLPDQSALVGLRRLLPFIARAIPKSADNSVPLFDQDVFWFDVPVNDAVPVGGRQCVCYFHGETNCLVDGNCLFLD